MRREHPFDPVADTDANEQPYIPAHPFLKWAGGKWAIAPHLRSLLPHDHRQRVYREPFLGGGAMFFYLQPDQAYLSDALEPLITAYRATQFHVEPLIHRLEQLRETHSKEQYYDIRTRFNAERSASEIERAAWLIYLNKTCYNGLFRTNRRGGFNVPIGRFDNPGIVDPTRLRAAAAVLARATISHARFDHLLDAAQRDDLIYFDPPYVPISKTANFSSYSDGSFNERDQKNLAVVFRELDKRGCLLALSNSDTALVRELYAGFDVSPVIAPRAISSKASTRGDVTELLIRNVARYPLPPR